MSDVEWLPRDTTWEALRIQWDVFRRMTPAKRLASALSMSDSLRRTVESGVRHRLPGANEVEVRAEVARLVLGDAVVANGALGQGETTMTQEEFVVWVANRLEGAGIPFMLSGSHASSVYGRPRATNHVDFVVDPTTDQLDAFLASLDESVYVDADSARRALAQRFMFDVIHIADGNKADLIVRKDRPFSIEEFGRRRMIELHGVGIPVSSAEDVILSKLEWNALGPSERHLQDALHVAVVQWDHLDRDYLTKWAEVLGVAASLGELLQRAEEAVGD